MFYKSITLGFFALVFLLFSQVSVLADGPVKPNEKDKCAVCGMSVNEHPKWIAEIIFKDGTYAVFDGVKDMLHYYFNMSKYNKSKTKDDIAEIYVTDYYTTKLMKADEVYFIIGSDVMGPMGNELIPVKGKTEANTFSIDHGGKKTLTFDKITPDDIPD